MKKLHVLFMILLFFSMTILSACFPGPGHMNRGGPKAPHGHQGHPKNIHPPGHGGH